MHLYQGKKLGRIRCVASPDCDDTALLVAEVFRIEGAHSEYTGECLAGSVPIWDLVEWAGRAGYLRWCDDVRNRSELQELRK